MSYIPLEGRLFIVAMAVLLTFGFWALYTVDENFLEDF